MEATSNKTKIQNTYSNLRTISFEEKKSPLLNEERVNSFLDAILEVKKSLKDKTTKINKINICLEKVTWFTDLEEEELMLINDLISMTKDFRSSLIRQYVAMGFMRKKGIAKEEIQEFKNAIDDLREGAEDLESVFFFLPEMPEFKETTQKLLSL